MKKKIVIPIVTVAVIAIIGIVGYNAMNSDKQDVMGIEVAVPENIEKGTIMPLEWIELASLTSYKDTLRTPIENILNIVTDESIGKTGMLYTDENGMNTQNNTLKSALQNSSFRMALEDENIISKINEIAINTYCDLDADNTTTNICMVLNGYFNLLPDYDTDYSNPQSTLSRCEFLTLLYRAETPVTPDAIKNVNSDFKSAIGDNKEFNDYDAYAQHLADKGYLTIDDKSLNSKTYSGSITRAEAIYMLMNQYYSEELAVTDSAISVTVDDAKNAGDIVKTNKLKEKGDYNKADAIRYMLKFPDKGVDQDIYKSLQLAVQKGIIDSETRWDEALTKEEAIEFIINTYTSFEQLTDASGREVIVDENTGITYIAPAKPSSPEFITSSTNTDGMTREQILEYNTKTFEQKLADGTLTNEDLYAAMTGALLLPTEVYEKYMGSTDTGFGNIVMREDGTSYVQLINGQIVEHGQKLPNGGIWTGNEVDQSKDGWDAETQKAMLDAGLITQAEYEEHMAIINGQ